jgi:hypothetical protein
VADVGALPLICKNLELAFESMRSKYVEARSAAYYQVSTELAAYKNVDMERAKSDLEEAASGVGKLSVMRRSMEETYWQPIADGSLATAVTAESS